MSRKDKITIAVAILVFAAALFITIYKNINSDNEASEQSSSVSIEDLDSSESSVLQSDDTSSEEEQQSAENGTIVSFSEEFLTAYYSIDSTETGIYDSVEHIKNYQQYMTDAAKEEYTPTEDDGSTADQMSILRQMGACKIYVSEESENKAKVLCLVYVYTEIDDQIPTDEFLLVGLNLEYQNDQWLVDDIVINHNLYDLQAPYAEIFN